MHKSVSGVFQRVAGCWVFFINAIPNFISKEENHAHIIPIQFVQKTDIGGLQHLLYCRLMTRYKTCKNPIYNSCNNPRYDCLVVRQERTWTKTRYVCLQCRERDVQKEIWKEKEGRVLSCMDQYHLCKGRPGEFPHFANVLHNCPWVYTLWRDLNEI
jgi:hypothetical protein